MSKLSTLFQLESCAIALRSPVVHSLTVTAQNSNPGLSCSESDYEAWWYVALSPVTLTDEHGVPYNSSYSLYSLQELTKMRFFNVHSLACSSWAAKLIVTCLPVLSDLVNEITLFLWAAHENTMMSHETKLPVSLRYSSRKYTFWLKPLLCWFSVNGNDDCRHCFLLCGRDCKYCCSIRAKRSEDCKWQFSANRNVSHQLVQWLANLETGLCFFAGWTVATNLSRLQRNTTRNAEYFGDFLLNSSQWFRSWTKYFFLFYIPGLQRTCIASSSHYPVSMEIPKSYDRMHLLYILYKYSYLLFIDHFIIQIYLCLMQMYNFRRKESYQFY